MQLQNDKITTLETTYLDHTIILIWHIDRNLFQII